MLFGLRQCTSHRADHSVVPPAFARLGITLALIFLMILVCPAHAQDTYCPNSVSVKQTAEKVPDGWTAGQDKSPIQLAALTFFDGPPDQEASLVYDSWTKRNGLAYAVWHFTPNSSQSTWLSCHYSSTNIVLSKKLPASTSECTVTYNPKVTVAGNPEIRKVACH